MPCIELGEEDKAYDKCWTLSALYGTGGVRVQPDCSVKGKEGFFVVGEVRTKFKR